MERVKGPAKTLAKVAMKEQEIVAKALQRVAKEQEIVAKEMIFVAITGRLGFFVEICHQTTPHTCITAATWDDKRFSRKTILMVLGT
jgi:hypothetical protein